MTQTRAKTGKGLEATSPKRWALADSMSPVLIAFAAWVGYTVSPEQAAEIIAAIVAVVGVVINVVAGRRGRVKLLETDATTGRRDGRLGPK